MSYNHDIVSDGSDSDRGYDSEAEELSRGATLDRSAKRRKLSHSTDEEDSNEGENENTGDVESPIYSDAKEDAEEDKELKDSPRSPAPMTKTEPSAPNPTKKPKTKTKEKEKEKAKIKPKPGVIYLSSLPPYLRPYALRNLLTQRGFSPITRLFLTPASKTSGSSSKNSRQLYTEGWIEFASKKTARRCAETLNATPVGGRKGGWYRDDVLNMKYLRGLGWDELMAGVREERREEEARVEGERRVMGGEARAFVAGVERGKAEAGMTKKRKEKGDRVDGGVEGEGVDRTWRQFEVQGERKAKKRKEDDADVADVQGMIL